MAKPRQLLDERLQTLGEHSARPHDVDCFRLGVGRRLCPVRVGGAERVAREEHRSVVSRKVLPEVVLAKAYEAGSSQ